ncbi:tyrosine-protein phosphatase [Agrilactobacillus yilanensis]|uniref:Tyrosine-protein phosphatase n=1 Tax=Agrilactobacillus yilanensis TaxID=2485997 RepID=A0ABW4J5Z0_9LACO|nr:tyrosine-protein phosphatase [Agrilactobacillus yilanensis]
MLDKQRVLPLEKGINFRELGGYSTIDGRHVKFQKIIRSAKLSTLDNKDLTYLKDYGLITDIDFRSQEEITKEPDKLPTGTTYRHLPVFATDLTENSKSPEMIEHEIAHVAGAGHDRMIEVYQNMIVQKGAQQAYRTFFEELLKNEQDNQAVLFHCTAGKDRTGIGAFFFLSALGVAKKAIAQDYLLTNTTYRPETEALIKKASNANSSPEMIDNLRDLFSVHIDFLNATEQEIKHLAGTPINYLKEIIGLSDTDLQDLRKIYLTD